MARSSGPPREEMGILVENLPPLSSGARNFMRHHPREACLAVAVALETAAAQSAAADGKAGLEVPEKLRGFIRPQHRGEEILGASAAAARLEVSRTTVYDWVERKTLIAWRSTKRGLSIPAAQILGPGQVVTGLAGIVDIVGDTELAWAFLTQEWPFEDAVTAPLELLKSGRVKEVLDAAPGFGSTFT